MLDWDKELFVVRRSRCLPGIRFQTVSPPLSEWLPRMDIAVFVGFAAKGSVHTPAAVESVEQFVAAFGDDVALAWDGQRGAPVYGHLGATVRAFFRNGGRRCWIIAVPVPAPGEFDKSEFLDPRLEGVELERLLVEADFLRYLTDPPETLLGIHAALGIEEATIIAVPDAVHLGWLSVAPALPEPAQPQPSLDRPEWWHGLGCDVRPEPLPAAPPAEHFLNCAIRLIAPPTLRLVGAPVEERRVVLDRAQTNRYTLVWQAAADSIAVDASVRYFLQEATQPGFGDATTIYAGPKTEFTLFGRSDGDYYYQVRVEIGDEGGVNSSDWSAGLAIRVTPASSTVQNSLNIYSSTLLERVHRSLLTLCAARGDLFAILTLPEHYREADAIQHAESVLHMSTNDERNAFMRSFVAIYHPWLIGREETEGGSPSLAQARGQAGAGSRAGDLRSAPPDGAICGIMAQRALSRGGWIAPANQLLEKVMALKPEIAPQRWQRLQEAQVNLIRQEARGVVCMSADTLSADPELRPINVRRLLILLRRLALREGARYVFEPNDDGFRRAVQHGFEAMLERMFMQGAFAGITASSAYQVVTDRTLNTPQSIEQGRFLIELRVAPSQPMSFLTVRLLQTNERLAVSEG